MAQKYNIEFFQSYDQSNIGTNLNDAYKKGSVKSLVSSSMSGAIPFESSFESSDSSASSASAYNSSFDINNSNQSKQSKETLWHFLGIDNLSLKNKQCIYNCGIDSLGCMERCSNPSCREQDNVNYEQCKFGCIRKGVTCTTNCMINENRNENIENIGNNQLNNLMLDSHQTDRIITQPIITTSSLNAPLSTTLITSNIENNNDYNNDYNNNYNNNDYTNNNNKNLNYDIMPTEVKGVYASLDTYAPFDMRVWPKNGKYGWTLDEINRLKRSSYDSEEVIEVMMSPELYPIKNEAPMLEFDYVKK